jgi:hypothetical protein
MLAIAGSHRGCKVEGGTHARASTAVRAPARPIQAPDERCPLGSTEFINAGLAADDS